MRCKATEIFFALPIRTSSNHSPSDLNIPLLFQRLDHRRRIVLAPALVEGGFDRLADRSEGRNWRVQILREAIDQVGILEQVLEREVGGEISLNQCSADAGENRRAKVSYFKHAQYIIGVQAGFGCQYHGFAQRLQLR